MKVLFESLFEEHCIQWLDKHPQHENVMIWQEMHTRKYKVLDMS
jgi:hypothetical protein